MEPDRLSISLIICAYNEEAYLGDCLDAVMEHVAPHVSEILVINNASTDRTAEIAAAYPGVRVVDEPEKGLPKARQRGYLASSGAILAYIDADTLPQAGWVAQIKETFAKESGISCLSGPYQYYDMPKFNQWFVSAWYVIAIPVNALVGYMATGGNMVFSRKALDFVGGFDTTIAFYGEDTAMARIVSAYGPVVFSRTFVMRTSNRRFREQGYFRVTWDYLLNFITIVTRGKPATGAYEDIR